MKNKTLFILAGNGPYDNRGCEAIVRGTAQILRRHFEDPAFLVCSHFQSEAQLRRQQQQETDADIRHCRMRQLPFFSKMGEVELPLHWVRKKVGDRFVWKGEQFIFDVLPFATRAQRFEVPRSSHYAALKSSENIASVQQQLREKL